MKSIPMLLFEAILIGACAHLAFKVAQKIVPPKFAVFAAGAGIHLVFEFLGLNKLYCKKYPL